MLTNFRTLAMTISDLDGSVLVRVRALVLEREESSGCWTATGKGELSNVSVVKEYVSPPPQSAPAQGDGDATAEEDQCADSASEEQPLQAESTTEGKPTSSTTLPDAHPSKSSANHRFVIYAHRIPDQTLVCRCPIGPDFRYHKVMPTFHNWESEGRKLGLVFQTAADGRAFDRGVMNVLVELLDGEGLGTTTAPPVHESDNEVFMAVDLPLKLNAGIGDISGSNTGNRNLSSSCPEPKTHSAMYKDTEMKPFRTCSSAETFPSRFPYLVQDTVRRSCPESPSSLKKAVSSNSLRFNVNKLEKSTKVCKHCRTMYVEEENEKGSCEKAPDCVKSAINWVTCIPCARAIVHTCVPDVVDFEQPCSCNPVEKKCSKRWMCIGLLSCILPGLCCYLPLKLCHLCGVSCGACGGKHEPLNCSPSSP